MTLLSAAEQAIRDGDPQGAIKLLQGDVRAKPSDARLRVFLFQLLCIQGDWSRALNQLQVAGELDASALAMVQTYRETIQCERLREDVFAGRKVPLLFGDPEPWLALQVEALIRDGRGEVIDAARLRAEALDQAPASQGSINGQPFDWIADADMRLGPVLEAVINGRYYWVPWSRLSAMTADAPSDLRDRVWMPVQLQFTNGGESVAFVPTRYAGTPLDDGLLALARRTDWVEPQPDMYVGQGQRTFSTDAGDVALMDVRSIVVSSSVEA